MKLKDDYELLTAINKIEHIKLFSNELIHKFDDVNSTPSDMVLDNYARKGQVNLENCSVTIFNSIILGGVFEGYTETFTYRNSEQTGERLIGYKDNVIIVTEKNTIAWDIKLWFYFNYNKEIFMNFISPIGKEKGIQKFAGQDLMDKFKIFKENCGLNDFFFDTILNLNWITFKNISQQIPTGEDWDKFLNEVNTFIFSKE